MRVARTLNLHGEKAGWEEGRDHMPAWKRAGPRGRENPSGDSRGGGAWRSLSAGLGCGALPTWDGTGSQQSEEEGRRCGGKAVDWGLASGTSSRGFLPSG